MSGPPPLARCAPAGATCWGGCWTGDSALPMCTMNAAGIRLHLPCKFTAQALGGEDILLDEFENLGLCCNPLTQLVVTCEVKGGGQGAVGNWSGCSN